METTSARNTKKQSLPYSVWMNEVDASVTRRCGLSAYDLPDYCYRDCYDSGQSAKSAASQAIRNARDS